MGGRFRQWDVVFCRCRQFRESWEIGGVDGLRWIRSGPCDFPLVCCCALPFCTLSLCLSSLSCACASFLSFSLSLSLARAPELLLRTRSLPWPAFFFFSCVGRLFSALCVVFVFCCLPIFVLPVRILSLVFWWFFSFPEIVSCLIFYFLFFWFGLRHEWKGDKEIVGEGETKRRRTTTTRRK